jgi:hypothetical protein
VHGRTGGDGGVAMYPWLLGKCCTVRQPKFMLIETLVITE